MADGWRRGWGWQWRRNLAEALVVIAAAKLLPHDPDLLLGSDSLPVKLEHVLLNDEDSNRLAQNVEPRKDTRSVLL